MANTKRLKNTRPLILNKLRLLLDMLRPFPRDLIPQRKLHSLVDSHGREMNVIFRVEDDLLPEPLGFLVRHASVAHLALDFAKGFSVVGKDAEK